MSRRIRAGLFLLAALVAAGAAATLADGYGKGVIAGYGRLRPVLVAVGALRRGRPIDPALASERLEVRRVPARFAPPDALAAPAEAIGLVPVAPLSAGAYLSAGQLRPPRSAPTGPRLGGARRPVEIAVSGAGALSAFGAQPVGAKVDVIVTSEPSGSGGGRTYLAAGSVPLLALTPATDGPGETTATLGLTRPQAIRLIEAESFARRVTVIPGA
jgi:Flp pilus assembly protein CpaB